MGRLSAMTLFRPAGSSPTMHAFTISIVYDHRSRPLYVSAMNNTTAVESRYQYDCDLEDRLLGSITTPNVAVTSTYTTETYAHVSPLLVGTLRTNYVSSVGTESYMYTANEENGLPIASYAFTRTGTITTTEVWRSASYPYGEYITPPGTVGPPPWRFAGQLVLPLSDARVWASGVNTLLRPALHLNRWRVYDPFLGRYLQPEPLALLGDEHYTNAFAYAGDDPWNFVDPTGLWPLPSNPDGLGSEWEQDRGHRDPTGSRWRNPEGWGLDFHPGRPGVRGHGGRPHWHVLPPGCSEGDDRVDNPAHGDWWYPDEEAPVPDPEPPLRFFPLDPLAELGRRVRDWILDNAPPPGSPRPPLFIPLPLPFPIPAY